jgi:hypothetical protein
MPPLSLEDQIWIISQSNPKGFTRYTYGLDKPVEGYCVAYEATQNCFGKEGLKKALAHAQTASQIIGGWENEYDRQYYFDSVRVYHNDATGRIAAIEAAIRERQIGFFDLSGQYVPIRGNDGRLLPTYEAMLDNWIAYRAKTNNPINWADSAKVPVT